MNRRTQDKIMKEIWKDIPGYEGLYQVSNFGRVKSLNYNHTNKEGILKYTCNSNGYPLIILVKNKKIKGYGIHKLVALTFIDNPNNYPCINHKNEIKTDNRVENLEWCTYKYNINYGTRTKRMIEKQRNHPNKSLHVFQYDKLENFIAEYPSIHEAERKTGICRSTIIKCCKNKLKSTGGYIWKYKEQC